MSNILAAFANSYINGEKARPDLATTYQASDPVVDQGMFAYGGQAAGQTANDVAPLQGYTPPPVAAPAPAPSVVQAVMQQPQQAQQPAYSGIQEGLFGGGTATANRPADQLATIKGVWGEYLNGKYTPTQLMSLMTQYGVNYADIAAATGKSPQEIQAMVGGRPTGTTASPTGSVSNVGVQANDDYMAQLNKYYGAYFGGQQPETTMLNSWYNTPYTPPVTGYQRTAQTAAPTNQAVSGATGVNTESSVGGIDSQTSGSGMSTTGVGRVTDAIKAEAANTFQKYIGLGLAPAVAITLTKNYLAESGFMDAVNASDDPIGTWLNAQYDFRPSQLEEGVMYGPEFGTTDPGGGGGGSPGGFGGISGAEGDPYSY